MQVESMPAPSEDSQKAVINEAISTHGATDNTFIGVKDSSLVAIDGNTLQDPAHNLEVVWHNGNDIGSLPLKREEFEAIAEGVETESQSTEHELSSPKVLEVVAAIAEKIFKAKSGSALRIANARPSEAFYQSAIPGGKNGPPFLATVKVSVRTLNRDVFQQVAAVVEGLFVKDASKRKEF